MKITDQSIPPELAAAYTRLIKTRPGASTGAKIATPKKAAHRPSKPRQEREQLKAFRAAVEALVTYLYQSTGTLHDAAFKAARLRELKSGTLNPEYWEQCTQTATQHLTTEPTSTPYAGARAYTYPDPDNQPTTPTYSNGTETTGPMKYEGQTADTYFRDITLTWERTSWELKNKFRINDPEPLLLKIIATIEAVASDRAARCGLSAILQYWNRAESTSKATTTEPPTTRPRSIYFRYRRPNTTPPYWTSTYEIRALLSLRTKSREDAANEMTETTLLLAPMPALGKRYNNNTSLIETMTATYELWQIKKQPPIVAHVMYIDSIVVIGGILYANSYAEGEPVREGDDFAALLNPHAGRTHALAIAAGVANAFTWGIDRYILIAPHSAGYYQRINSSYDIADAYINY